MTTTITGNETFSELFAISDLANVSLSSAIAGNIVLEEHGEDQEFNDITAIGKKIVESIDGHLVDGRDNRKTLIQLAETNESVHLTSIERDEIRSASERVTTSIATATGEVTQTAEFLFVSYTTTGEVTITILNAMESNGYWFSIKDAGFNAKINNIVLTCENALTKIEGSVDDFKIKGNGETWNFINYSGDWFIF